MHYRKKKSHNIETQQDKSGEAANRFNDLAIAWFNRNLTDDR